MNNKERYINVEKAISVLRLRSQQLAGMYGDLGGAASGAALLLDSLADEEAEDVVKGEWVNIRFSADGNSSADCNRCGATVHTNFTNSVNFCPNCGADMKGEKTYE